MAAGKSVGNKVMTTPKTRRKSKGKRPWEHIGKFVWLLYIALALSLIGHDVNSGPPSTNHIVVDVSGFSDGFGAFEKACAKAQ